MCNNTFDFSLINCLNLNCAFWSIFGEKATLSYLYYSMDYAWNLISSGLEYVGILDVKPKKVLVAGLDNSGKTTFCYLLRDNKFQCHEPNLYRNEHEVTVDIDNAKLELCDYGYVLSRWGLGPRGLKILKEYVPDVKAFIYMIDAADPQRFDESRKELHQLLTWNDDNDRLPILILANKVDKKTFDAVNCNAFQLKIKFGIVSSTSLRDLIFGYIHNIEKSQNDECLSIPTDIKYLCVKYYDNVSDKNELSPSALNVPIKLLLCSIVKRVGFADGLKWLVTAI